MASVAQATEGRSDRWSVATPGRNDGAVEAMEAGAVNEKFGLWNRKLQHESALPNR